MPPQLLIPEFQGLASIIEDETLYRYIFDSLFPTLQYRAECDPIESWEASLGTSQTFTKQGNLPVNTRPRVPNMDPDLKNAPYEQWVANAYPLHDSVNVDMPTVRATIDDGFMRGLKNIIRNAGLTLNRAPRNRLFGAYATGHTTSDTAGSGVTSIAVASIAGFEEQLTADGKLLPVGVNNPKQFYINGVLQTARVIAAAADDPLVPNGRGVLTIEAPGVTVAANDPIVAYDAPTIIRSGGGLSVDALANNDYLTMADIRLALAIMRRNSVPPHPDGLYHVHLDPVAENHLFMDQEFRQAAQGQIRDDMYAQFAIKDLLGCRFYRNEESPTVSNQMGLQQSRPSNSTTARLGMDIGAEVINASGVNVVRTIITGGESICEKYIPESDYVTQAGTQGVQKFGTVTVTNNRILIDVERVRIIMRAPQNVLQNQVTIAWSWSGDFPIPSDRYGGSTNARFKRACVIESGSPF